ncbi:FimD/PapC C-terminal domain-containing protein, partial [Klebsiella pneumoniae]|uniref:FimD/PapC C-terminal domain-containing protein n=1 Tax=Klebsiella pneumoniae TaxID=573 RepID=UPI00248D2D7D
MFETFSGRNYLVNAVIPGNIAPPVGAIVRDAKGRNHGLVGLHGALYASGVEDNSRLEVRWGSHTNE